MYCRRFCICGVIGYLCIHVYRGSPYGFLHGSARMCPYIYIDESLETRLYAVIYICIHIYVCRESFLLLLLGCNVKRQEKGGGKEVRVLWISERSTRMKMYLTILFFSCKFSFLCISPSLQKREVQIVVPFPSVSQPTRRNCLLW